MRSAFLKAGEVVSLLDKERKKRSWEQRYLRKLSEFDFFKVTWLGV